MSRDCPDGCFPPRLRPEAYQRMVERGALAMYDSAKLLHRLNMAPIVNDPDYWRTLSRNHMAAQGITCPQAKKLKKKLAFPLPFCILRPMKYTISVILLSLIAGILYLLAAPQYAVANHNAASGSVMEMVTAIPAFIFVLTGCGLTLFGTIFGIAFLVSQHNEAHGISSLPSD